jgi:pyridinium-3,5-biscarboxylic acid mononucleotide sulfurtransferase
MTSAAEKLTRLLALLSDLGNLARIEVSPEDIAKLTLPEVREKIYQKLKQLGFTFVTVDLAGYRMGSLNELLDVQTKKQFW